MQKAYGRWLETDYILRKLDHIDESEIEAEPLSIGDLLSIWGQGQKNDNDQNEDPFND